MGSKYDDRNIIIRESTFLQICRSNYHYKFQLRDINERIRELLWDCNSFITANGKFSYVSYEIDTGQSAISYNRYILHVSALFIMEADRL